MPHTDKDGDWITEWAPNQLIYRACKSPMLLHFDDVDKAPPPAQNALLGLLGERRFRSTHLHKNTLIVLSGNRVDDDIHATELSESMRTRITPINLDFTVTEFSKWGTATGLIHPVNVGYVNYKPEHLHHIPTDSTDRPATPRGWREASDQMFHEDEKVWKEILTLKVGAAIANNHWAWYEILRKIDVDHILQTGTVKDEPTKDAEKRKFNYAAVFAVSQTLNKKGIKDSMTGLPIFVENLEKEMRVAFLVQLPKNLRANLGKTFPKAASMMMEQLIN